MSRKSRKQQINKLQGVTDGTEVEAGPVTLHGAGRRQDASLPAVSEPARKPALYSREVIGICVLLVIAVFLVFGQTLHFDFVNYDDNGNVYETPQVTAGVSLSGIKWAVTHTQIGRWTPIATISRQIDCQFFALRAGGHHLTNVVLHALAAVLLFLFLLDLTGFIWRSGFVTAVFALHPLHVEAVAWVSERSELLCAVFFILALWSYSNYTRKSLRRLHYAIAMFWFALGFMSKPMIVTLPFVMLLLDYWPLGRFGKVSPSRLIFEKTPFFLLVLVFCAATVFVAGQPVLAIHLPLLIRFQNAIVSCAIYLRQTVWPSDLAAYYPPRSFSPAEVAVSLALLCSLSAVAFFWRKKHPVLVTGWLWFLGMIAPVIGLKQITDYTHADRYMYLPQVGLCLAIAWMLADYSAQWRHRRALLGGIAGVVLFVLGAVAYRQTSSWRDSFALWTHTLACTKDNTFAHNNLGFFLAGQGRTEDAATHFREAIQIDPAFWKPHYNLAKILSQQGQTGEAIAQYQMSLQIYPAFAEGHYNFGLVLESQGRTGEAIDQYREALKLNPDDTLAVSIHTNLGDILVGQGRVEEGAAHFLKAIQIDPGDWMARYDLGKVFYQQGQTGEAIDQFRTSLQINPACAEAHYNLGVVLQLQGQTDEAIDQFREALKLNPADPEALNNLGYALFQLGRTEEAIAQYREALRIDPNNESARKGLDIARHQTTKH